jgi:hypothetical protein
MATHYERAASADGRTASARAQVLATLALVDAVRDLTTMLREQHEADRLALVSPAAMGEACDHPAGSMEVEQRVWNRRVIGVRVCRACGEDVP